MPSIMVSLTGSDVCQLQSLKPEDIVVNVKSMRANLELLMSSTQEAIVGTWYYSWEGKQSCYHITREEDKYFFEEDGFHGELVQTGEWLMVQLAARTVRLRHDESRESITSKFKQQGVDKWLCDIVATKVKIQPAWHHCPICKRSWRAGDPNIPEGSTCDRPGCNGQELQDGALQVHSSQKLPQEPAGVEDPAPELVYGYVQIDDYAKKLSKKSTTGIAPGPKRWVLLSSGVRVHSYPLPFADTTTTKLTAQSVRSCLRQPQQSCQDNADVFATPRSSAASNGSDLMSASSGEYRCVRFSDGLVPGAQDDSSAMGTLISEDEWIYIDRDICGFSLYEYAPHVPGFFLRTLPRQSLPRNSSRSFNA